MDIVSLLGADDTGAPVPSQLLPASRSTRALQHAMVAADALPDPAAAGTHELAFLAALPPLGYVTYSLEPCEDNLLFPTLPQANTATAARAARPLLVRPGAGPSAASPAPSESAAAAAAAAATSRVAEWAPGAAMPLPDLAGVGAGLQPDGRLTVGQDGLAVTLEAASGRIVALRNGRATTELSTSAVRFRVGMLGQVQIRSNLLDCPPGTGISR